MHFDALLALDSTDFQQANERAFRSMLMAARALVRTRYPNVGNEPERIIEEFKTRFVDTELFFDKYAKGKFAQYLFDMYENPPTQNTREAAYRAIEEAQLFIEACHAAEARISGETLIKLP